MSFNKVILMGNLTRDPDYRVTPSGHQICKIGIAVNRRFTTQSGEHKEETTFVDVDAFGRQAETISRYFTKGRPILIEGRLRMDQWQTPQGENRSRLTVSMETFSFVGGSEGHAGGQGGGQQHPAQPQPFAQHPVPPPPADMDYAPPPEVSAPLPPVQHASAPPPPEEEEDVPF